MSLITYNYDLLNYTPSQSIPNFQFVNLFTSSSQNNKGAIILH